MLCGYPVSLGNGKTRPCGLCMPCRINKKRRWVGKMVLEAKYTTNDSSFITLTYAPERLPKDGSLEPWVLRHFTQRLKRSGVGSFRYFYVGEYGDQTFRPHYHGILFGVPPTFEKKIREAWQFNGTPIGHVMVGPVANGAISYVAHYCTKKLTGAGDERLGGRRPEFTRMSQKPTLGFAGLKAIAAGLQTQRGAHLLADRGVPTSYRVNGRMYPLSRNDFNYLCSEIGAPPGAWAEMWSKSDRWELDVDVASIMVRAEQEKWPDSRLASRIAQQEQMVSDVEAKKDQERRAKVAQAWWNQFQSEKGARRL